ncbi:hypothetical protein DFH09DRAFT_911641 [Mycena vulgaris]|nr:hypothetical protein DFH09DRAFT_911641 [Mycena vulgaris]
MSVDGPLQNKIAAYLTTNYEISRAKALGYPPTELSLWGKLKQLSGGDLIHAWDLVSAYHTSRDAVRDATFIQYTLEIDKNKHFRNLPVELERKEERTQSARERTIVLAAVAEAKLTRKNAVGMAYFDAKSSDLGPASEVIDVGSIDCLAGRIPDLTRWACLLRPAVAAKFKLIDESTLEEGNET